MQIDFEGRAPVDPDAQGISQLLQRLFLRAHINCNQMADLIIGEHSKVLSWSIFQYNFFVSSPKFYRQCDLSVRRRGHRKRNGGRQHGRGWHHLWNHLCAEPDRQKDQPSIAQLRTYILDRAKTHASTEVQQQLKEILDSEQRHVGFLINERFINIPAQISVPLLQSLQQEIEAAKAKKMKYDFGTLLLLVKFYRKESKKGKPGEDVYTNAEDELLSDRAKFSFEYSMASETDSGMSGDWLEGDAVMTPYRKLLVLEAKKLPQLIDDIQRFINGE